MDKYFSYDPEGDFETHATEDEAKKAAQDLIDTARDYSEDGWADCVEQICWGVISETSTQVNKVELPEGDKFDHTCDYKLMHPK